MRILHLNKHASNTPGRKRKKQKNTDELVYYSPAEGMSAPQLAIGLVLRTLIVYIGIVGIACFLCGAAGLTTAGSWRAVSVGPWFIALLALPAAIACGVASLGKWFAVGTAAVYTGAYFGIIAAIFGNPIDFTVQSALRIYNYALYTVSGYGYFSLADYMVSDGYNYGAAAYAEYDPQRFVGVFLLCTVIGLILFLTVQKKVRLIPLTLFISVIAAPVLTYNVAQGTSGIGLTVIFVCSAIALKIYDRRYSGRIEKKHSKKNERRQRRLAKKSARLEKKNLKKEKRIKADKILVAAVDAGADIKKARAARKAYIKAMRDGEKAEKKARKAEKRVRKKLAKEDRKRKKFAEKDKKKRIAQLKKNGEKAAAAEAKKALIEAKNSNLSEKKLMRREKAKKSRRISYAGGYTAAGVALTVFLAVILPMTAVHGAFNTIDPIYNRVQIASAYVTAYLRGNDVDLNDLDSYGLNELTPRMLTFDPIEYQDKEMLRVETEGYNNVYLRSWIGTDFVWGDGKWVSADHDEVISFRERFGREFTPDEITTAFYSNVFPSTTEVEKVNEYKNLSKFGFNVQQINVWRNRGQSLLLCIPSHMNTDIGLLKYGLLEDNEFKYSIYFDGVYSSRFYKYGTGYSTVSYISNYSRAGVDDGISDSLEYYQRSKDFIRKNMIYDSSIIDKELYEFDKSLQEDGIDYLGTNLGDRFFNYMTSDERSALLESFDKEEEYSAYVHERYTERTGSQVVEAVAGEIAASLDPNAGVYEKVRAVADYFNNNFTYTLSPDQSKYYGDKPVLEAFLEDVKEGYCSHFATAAAAILREYGLPTRYCEGYVAHNFVPAVGGRSASLRTYVKDSDAHAWIEVYIDGMGWTQFEVTPGDYSEDMYNASSATIEYDPSEITVPDTPDTPDTPPHFDPDTEPDLDLPTDEEAPGDVGDIIWFLKRVAVGAAIVLFFVIVYFIIKHIRKKANDAVADRFRVIDVARSEERYNDERIDNRKTARQINDYILAVFELIGCAPQKGELSEEYAARMRENYGKLSLIDVGEVIAVMQKEEFGHGLSFDEMYLCAEYLSDIITAVYNDLSLWQKIRLRYIKRKI